MIIESDKLDVDVVADARAILLIHTPTEDGLCRGCYEFARTFVLFPCSQTRWAEAVLGGERS